MSKSSRKNSQYSYTPLFSDDEIREFCMKQSALLNDPIFAGFYEANEEFKKQYMRDILEYIQKCKEENYPVFIESQSFNNYKKKIISDILEYNKKCKEEELSDSESEGDTFFDKLKKFIKSNW